MTDPTRLALVQTTPTSAAPATRAPTLAPSAPLVGNTLNVAVLDVVERVRPAVVQISNLQVQVDQFNQPFTIPAGVGSGVIYDRQGLILTNNHVVEGAQQLAVLLPDGRNFPAQLLGADPRTDLAVVKITGDNLPVAVLGNSDQLRVGEWVVAIGNALGLPGGPTVTAGVVSAVGRTVQEPGTGNQGGSYLFDMIQTDAAINPGNSGGPLMNLAGEVVGINTLGAGTTSSGVPVQGISFAISISGAKPIADQLVAKGRVDHPYMGITYVPLTPAIAAQIGSQQKQGALITDVVSGSPAAQAGIRARDILVAVEGQAIQEEGDLSRFLNGKQPGDSVTFSVLRDGQTQQVQVTLGRAP